MDGRKVLGGKFPVHNLYTGAKNENETIFEMKMDSVF